MTSGWVRSSERKVSYGEDGWNGAEWKWKEGAADDAAARALVLHLLSCVAEIVVVVLVVSATSLLACEL